MAGVPKENAASRQKINEKQPVKNLPGNPLYHLFASTAKANRRRPAHQ
jgi:hypothetical protein